MVFPKRNSNLYGRYGPQCTRDVDGTLSKFSNIQKYWYTT